jgi:DNA-binding transcriptional MerR regulator
MARELPPNESAGPPSVLYCAVQYEVMFVSAVKEKIWVLSYALYRQYEAKTMSGQTSEVVHSFRTAEVQALTGLSKHMVDYLCRHGLLPVSGSPDRGYGKIRAFDFTDILVGRAIRKLLDSGVSVLAMRTSMSQLRNLLHSDAPATLRDRRIVISGGIPHLSLPDQAPINLLAGGQMAFSFVLEIEELWQKAAPLLEQRRATTRVRLERARQTRKERMA